VQKPAILLYRFFGAGKMLQEIRLFMIGGWHDDGLGGKNPHFIADSISFRSAPQNLLA